MTISTLQVYHVLMYQREVKSLLHDNPERMDQPDSIIAAGDLQDICRSLDYCLRLAEDTIIHPYGSLSLYEERFYNSHLKGWILHTPPNNDTDYAIAMDLTSQHNIFLLSSWQYAAGIKTQIQDYPLNASVPRIRENYYFRELPNNSVSAGEFTKLQLSVPIEATIKDPHFEDIIDELSAEYHKFTLHSLYKVNKIMRVLRGDDVA